MQQLADHGDSEGSIHLELTDALNQDVEYKKIM